jgi:hypothetical protein
MAFTKKQIDAAKKGVHLIRWQPGAPPRKQVVLKVRGEFVWVVPAPGSVDSANLDRLPVKLNWNASARLMKGEYRGEV